MPPTDPLPAHLKARRQTIGDNIRRARRDAQLTQEKLGERCGIDRQAVNRIEVGVQSPLPAHLKARRQTIGDNIRRARRDAQLTQEKLGERCGIDRQAVNRIEVGVQSPLLDTLLRIADALDVPLADLMRY